MTDGALLTLVQWLSPAFPTGAFAYSHGLEQAIGAGTVRDAGTLRDWLADILRFGAGRQDAVLLCAAMAPGADIGALDALALALQPSAERLRETTAQGAAFAATVAGIGGPAPRACCLPVAVGAAAAPLGLPPARVAALYLQGFASNLCTIAVRHVPLGQTQGQAVLAALTPTIISIARAAATTAPEDIGNAALAADLDAIAHETRPVRLFAT